MIWGKCEYYRWNSFEDMKARKSAIQPCLSCRVMRIHSYSHLFCTLISENQGLEKLRSILNIRKISGPAELIFFSVHLIFFSVCHLIFFQIYTINLKKSRWQTEKKLRCTEKKNQVCMTWKFSQVWNRPWFLIKVQIKRPFI